MSFQEKIADWMRQCFGEIIPEERNHRFLEESLELVQSVGVSKEDVLKLVDYVYSRPQGQPTQEVGGVMVTLAGLCEAHRINLTEAMKLAVDECWMKFDRIRAKRATKPAFGPLPGKTDETR